MAEEIVLAAMLVGLGGLALSTAYLWFRVLRLHQRSVADLSARIDALTAERDRARAESARLAARQAVSEHSDLLRSLAASAPIVLLTVDASGAITAAEGAVKALLGRDAADALGWAVQELLPHQPEALRAINDALAGRSIQLSVEVRGRAFIVSFFPLPDGSGKSEGALVLALEVTEQRQAEAALREQSDLAQALVDAQSDLGDLVFVTENDAIIYVNEAASRITGRSEDELLGLRSFYDLVPNEHLAALPPRMRSAGNVVRFETVIQRPDGEPVALEMAEIMVALEKRSRVVSMGRDITERREAERDRQALLARLVTAEETSRQQVAQDIHDESIQSLFAALMRIHLLQGAVRDPKVLEELERLGAAIDRSITSLRHLLFELRPTTLDSDGLGAALRLYLDEMRKDTGIDVALEDHCSEPAPETRVMLYRIAQEALVNVRKHARARRVDVSLDDVDHGIRLKVHDDGQGFAVDPTGAPRPGHLGLVAMRERAEMAHGRCAISSAAGEGTTVEVWLPGTGQELSAA